MENTSVERIREIRGKQRRCFGSGATLDVRGRGLPKLHEYLTNVLQLEAVACKAWLTNKVDRSVTGKVARQQ